MLDITPIPAFTDNYIWAISDGRNAWLVDPGEAEPALAWLAQKHLSLQGILITHHHLDHIGGVTAILHHIPNIPVYGPSNPNIGSITRKLQEGDTLTLGNWQASVMAVPAHTLDHIAYYLAPTATQPGALFCGDTLFAAGCGRLFEGTPAQLHRAMQRFQNLPPETLVCCAHEYTLANLRFAEMIEPDSTALRERAQQEQCKRQAGFPTLPSTIALERATNPFMRAHIAQVKTQAARHAGETLENEVAVIAALRSWKDNF